MRNCLLAFGLLAAMCAAAEENSVPTMAPEDLPNYHFQNREESPPPMVEDLSVGQRFILRTQREEIRQLIAEKLGVLSLKGDASDLVQIQALYDRRVLKADQIREWQWVGVLFGDILAEEFGLEWVSYEDELGVSKALRWKDTQNFVFPVTVFSKRVQFGEKIDVQVIYDKISADIRRFIEYENRIRG